MKDYGWNVKVGDLLHNPGKVDYLEFSNKYLHEMEEILEPGISGKIFFQSLNSTSVQVIIEFLSCSVKDISDITGDDYIREVYFEDYEVLFGLAEKNKSFDELDHIYESYNDIYEISEKDESINLESCIKNAIKSHEPLVKRGYDENLLDGGEIDESFDDEELY